MKQQSTVKPMPQALEDEVMADCVEILSNVCNTRFEVSLHMETLTGMCVKGASEEEIYAKLKFITEEEYAQSTHIAN